jgi:hydroxymethylpyrimidine pyrophosphatase-like HAD family hydrolase
MGNSTPTLKKQADTVVADNEHSGVAEAIYKIMNDGGMK